MTATTPSARTPAAGTAGRPAAVRHQRVALVDLLDRVLGSGVVVVGDVTLSIADVDLVTISLRALVSSVGAGMAAGLGEKGPDR
jgi:gas vesicle protein GvpA/GvpJ/GvpM family